MTSLQISAQHTSGRGSPDHSSGDYTRRQNQCSQADGGEETGCKWLPSVPRQRTSLKHGDICSTIADFPLHGCDKAQSTRYPPWLDPCACRMSCVHDRESCNVLNGAVSSDLMTGKQDMLHPTHHSVPYHDRRPGLLTTNKQRGRGGGAASIGKRDPGVVPNPDLAGIFCCVKRQSRSRGREYGKYCCCPGRIPLLLWPACSHSLHRLARVSQC